MNKNPNPPEKTTLEIRRAPTALKIALCLLILLSMGALAALRLVHNGILAETQKLTEEAAAVEAANADLQDKTANVDTVQGIRDIAREELGLVDPNTVVITPHAGTAPTTAPTESQSGSTALP